MTSALLNPGGPAVDDEWMAVWFVCSGWGLPAVVHAVLRAGGERMQVAHRNIHN